MGTATSKTFRSGNSEAVRLPREVAYGREVELTIIRSGDVLTIFPKRPSPAEVVEALARLPRPSAVEERDVEPLPERPDL